MYRPEGWKNDREKYLLKDIDISIGNIWPVIYEAGADAMLEGLKKKGAYQEKGSQVGGLLINNTPWAGTCERNGWLVFIPEEE